MRLLMDADGPDTEYVTQQNRRVAEIMTYGIISAEPDTSVSDIAILVRVAPRTDTAARPTV
jgi:predicted nucleotidyltransferase